MTALRGLPPILLKTLLSENLEKGHVTDKLGSE